MPELPPEEEEEEEDPLVRAQREAEEAERRERELSAAQGLSREDDDAMRAFYSDLREVDRENEVDRILGAFKINPFEQVWGRRLGRRGRGRRLARATVSPPHAPLSASARAPQLGMRFDTDVSEVRRQYRKVSLMVHPDKCKHPRAKEAFEVRPPPRAPCLLCSAGARGPCTHPVPLRPKHHTDARTRAGAHTGTLCCRSSATRRRSCWTRTSGRTWCTCSITLRVGGVGRSSAGGAASRGGSRCAVAAAASPAHAAGPPPPPPPLAPADQVLAEWRKAAKHDAAVALAAALHDSGKAGVEEAYLASAEFHEVDVVVVVVVVKGWW